MTPSLSTYAAIRFGYGFRPGQAAPAGAEALINGLSASDQMPQRFPIRSFNEQVQSDIAYGRVRQAVKDGSVGAEIAFKLARKRNLSDYRANFLNNIARPLVNPDGFRERLVGFWADHFSIVAKGKGLPTVSMAYVEEAIRPHITSNFKDLLRSAVTHPVMLVFLDQVLSVGPNSPQGKTKGRGLNENLAREILELHTLGVGGSYRQGDVRQFAELLTGLQFNKKTGFRFQPNMAEPGAEKVLGRLYGGQGPATIQDIYQALDDLARHPDTAAHIARKLVVHFVSDRPDKGLVDHVANAFTASDGDLIATYGALLEHPKAWQDFGQKAKQPFDFIISSLRAMDTKADVILGLSKKNSRLYLSAPMQVMGQPYQAPGGPDGWPEAAEDWITPQGMAARIQWALLVTQALAREQDPQEFAKIALADAGSGLLSRAVGAAESRREGIALVLASPQFNRR